MPLYGRRTSKPNPGTPIDWAHPLAQGLVAAWPINEGSGIPIDAASLAIGTTSNATWASSPYGSALTFNGTTQYVRAVMTGGLLSVVGPFTVACLLAVPSSANNGFLFDCRNPSLSSNGYYLVLDGSGHFGLGSTAGGVASNLYTTAVVSGGAWHTIAGAMSGKGATDTALYVDGVPVTTGQLPSYPQPSGANAVIGARYDNAARLFAGSLAWLAVWSRGLSAAENAALAANPWQMFAPPGYRLYGGTRRFRRTLYDRAGSRGVA